MKTKILIALVVISIVISLGTINSFAAGNIEMDIQGQTTIKETEKTVELILSLGSFTEIEEGIPLGYQGTLTYDENLFSGITVEGLNGWTVSYESSTKVFMGEIDVAKANTQIAKITLTIKDGVANGTSGKVSFSNILLTDGTNDVTFNKEVTLTFENDTTEENNNQNQENEEIKPPEENNEESESNKETNSNISTNSSSIKGSNTDKTTASTKLPAAGLRNILIIAVVIMIVFMVVFKIKSRDIKY